MKETPSEATWQCQRSNFARAKTVLNNLIERSFKASNLIFPSESLARA